MSAYTISLSVIISMMLTILSIYVLLGATTGNFLYLINATVFASVLTVPVHWIIKKTRQTEEQLQREIQELKKKYLW
jgi:hypothetical protein